MSALHRPLLTAVWTQRWLWPIWGAVALVLLVGVEESRRPDLSDPADLRQIYSGDPALWPRAWIDEGVDFVELAPMVLPDPPAPGSAQAARVALGEQLFKDPVLSDSGHIACESCHNRRLGWSDGLPRSFGHERAEGRRNAPSLYAASTRDALFWDGRAASLEEQAIGPLTAPEEMAVRDLEEMVARVEAKAPYLTLFGEAFGEEEVTLDAITQALASFERQLDRQSDLDRFLSGKPDALSDPAVQGLHLFRTKARCANCHFGPTLSDGRFHNLGLSYFGRRFEDLGRYEVTGVSEDAGRFLTPSLRHVARSAPYMHNGLFPSLSGVVALYNGGGGASHARDEKTSDRPLFGAAKTSSPHLRPLALSQDERAALVAFLNAL
ncbi:cytochrome-c peroxidase [Thioclava marina]|uniref:cytochrome-c peroxidase n=1 Tax=Thioclava marina TaxID=1915077 RepID=UPI00099800FB|nr:cytochrome c peroxidase [Thioclava marina]